MRFSIFLTLLQQTTNDSVTQKKKKSCEVKGPFYINDGSYRYFLITGPTLM